MQVVIGVFSHEVGDLDVKSVQLVGDDQPGAGFIVVIACGIVGAGDHDRGAFFQVVVHVATCNWGEDKKKQRDTN